MGIKPMIQSKTLMKDLLHNLDPSAGAGAEYGRGILVGAVCTVMAMTMCEFGEAIGAIKPFIPEKTTEGSVPEVWLPELT